MQYIVKLFPEITIKSPPVRKRLTRQVRDNLRRLLKPLDERIDVQRDWEKIEVSVPDATAPLLETVERVLSSTPGIANFARVVIDELGTFEEIGKKSLIFWRGKLQNRSFCVRVKRSGRHDFRSVDVERHVGAVLLAAEPGSKVNLTSPEVTVALEIRGDKVFFVDRTFPGLGGFPLGSQDSVLSLISGGFDSTVASYLAIKRGLCTHFCFFNLGGRAHELGVKEVANYIWRHFGASHRVKFVTVPFEGVVSEILSKVDNAYMGVVLKRMMLRAASRVAADMGLAALVTGESVAQVSSQTLHNLALIDEVSGLLTLRPLAMMDKGDIIDIARHIGTEVFAANMPEYCGVISVRPTTRAKREKLEYEETAFDSMVLEEALTRRRVEHIDELLNDDEPPMGDSVTIYQTPQPGFTIVDIRHPDEIAHKSLNAGNSKVVEIPFFLLDKAMPDLGAGENYLLYCDRGVMSRLHAELLYEKGYHNVGVYRPA